MQILDWALLALVILAAGLAVRKIIRDRRVGKYCCGNCAGCAANCSASRAARRNAADTARCDTDGFHTL
ncbi:MAG: FeoB-associated Cys-rich membrane protein [Subdoligranulum sp.]|nr:FeoB-associated Cys-rich membrane protein [Subdoligranulum sp.]